LKPELLKTLASLDYETMTEIQQKSLPSVLKGLDVIAQAKTGSGKTAAFGLGVLQALNVKRFRVQSLVLCPTRELADQVAQEIRKLARGIHNIKVLTLFGGVPMGPQIGSLEHGAHILVGTPGRILDHLHKGRIDFSELNTFVLDEADRMLDMGFQDAIDDIVAELPKDRQTLFFSATYPKQIEQMAKQLMPSPVRITVESKHDSVSIEQNFFHVDSFDERLTASALLLRQYQPESCVIFCNMKRDTEEVADYLVAEGFSAIALHGDLEQKDRDQRLVRFANKSVSILVATDVAARGLDIDALGLVINCQLPHDPEVYVHRIGRTGRSGNSGVAASFVSVKDGIKMAELEDYLGNSITEQSLPASQNVTGDVFKPKMATLRIDGGKKQKVRPGDILGALTAKKTIAGGDVGKINVFDYCAYVAVDKSIAKDALHLLEKGKIKGRQFRAWRVR
jgi:ATP-independent RNA helicase DbpA